jgi:hypothetical protein
VLDAPADRKVPDAKDAEDKGTTSAETLIPGSIVTDVPEKPMPSVTDQTPISPPSGGRGRKRPRITVRRPDPVPQVNQVMIQVVLPLTIVLAVRWIWLLWRTFLDAYLKHFTECHRPQLLVSHPRLATNLCRRSIVGFH